ncbi:MAG: NAD(P)-dependent oxidoreductase [Agarilytica sp.]
MKIAITGASGFIGRHVVAAAVAQGFQVLAIVRSTPLSEWGGDPHIETQCFDLSVDEKQNLDNLAGAFEGCDVVIHLAAVMQGPNQFHDTMHATKNVLRAMDVAGVKKFVALSSISILDYPRCNANAQVDETCAANALDKELGPYAYMKRAQEAMCRRWQSREDETNKLVVLRPGLVFDENNLSDAHVGFKFLASLHVGEVPVVSVQGVARACVAAAVTEAAEGETVHLLNDKLPKQAEYISALQSKGVLAKRIGVPWGLYNVITTVLRMPLSFIGKVPDGLRKNSVHARQKPLRFSNEKAKKLLGWQPSVSLNTH